MGRAGQGGYGTVQHAYDTRLKRDVAIKCIQITQADIARSRTSIREAQRANESQPLLKRSQQRKVVNGQEQPGSSGGADGEDSISGFVPLTTKINEPSFLTTRERNQAKYRKRRGYANGRQQNAISFNDANANAEDYEDGNSQSFNLSEFANYSSFKGQPKGSGQGRAQQMQRTSVTPGNTPANTPIKNVTGRLTPGENIGGFRRLSTALPNSQQGQYGSPSNSANHVDSIEEQILEAEPVERIDPISQLERIPGLEEARTAAHLNDANIVTVYDCAVEGNMVYIIMEYVEGKTLAKIMREMGNDITLDIVAYVFSAVSHALEIAHKANVLHLDVKPENVIINTDGDVKVTDFGLSTLMDASGQGVTGGGTIGYMPLEQMRQLRLDVRTDEWGLASFTYEMLSGKNPFKVRTLEEAPGAIENAELIIPSLCWENIDENVDDVIFCALSPDMEDRYGSVKMFAEELQPMLGNVREGRAQLAAAVKGPDPIREERKEKPAKPYVPLIDRLGVRGSNIILRVFSVLGCAMLGVISLMNFRFTFGAEAQSAAGETVKSISSAVDTTFGLFSTIPIAAVVILVLLLAAAAIFPRFAMPAAYLLFVITLFFNQAWAPAIVLLLATGAWWWFFGRHSDTMCTLVVLQPLFGAIGFASIVPILAGAILDVRDALLATLMAVISAFVFASMGSHLLVDWQMASNFIVAVNPSIAGATMMNGFGASLTSAMNWCTVAGWISAAAAYSFLCRRGTHAFDIVGSVFAGLLVIAGVVIVPIITGDFSMLTPLVLAGAIVPAIVGVVLALMNIPDRVRMAPGEW